MTQTTAIAEPHTSEAEPVLRLQLSRIIPAERARVYAAWTRPELMAQWFAPGHMTCPSVTSDLQPGGAYRVEMAGSMDGSDAAKDGVVTAVASGAYVEIIPGQKLQYTWTGSWAPEEETLITVEFNDVEGGTEVRLTHERFSSMESLRGHQHGWDLALPKLARLFVK
jgi:uncharacterized protein YndB with AHSA1/START domain